MANESSFGVMQIGLATADDIRQWSNGEVRKPETINYRTLKPEKDGLFCEKIFGPTRDWECACGKYKRVRFKGIVCERCGVEVTRSKVRRERMGHIELAAPVTHIWYFKGVPSRLGYLLDLAPKDLEKVIYFAAYMITSVDDEARREQFDTLEQEYQAERKQLEKTKEEEVNKINTEEEKNLEEAEKNAEKASVKKKIKDTAEKERENVKNAIDTDIDRVDNAWDRFKNMEVGDLEGDEILYRDMHERYGQFFEGSMGAEAIQKRLENFDMDAVAEQLRDEIQNGKGQKKTRALKRLKVVGAFLQTGNSPVGMVLNAVPIIPPDLRPMVQLDGGRFATSDLNDLYRRVINRNNRLKRLLDLDAPEIIVNNEKRMLQEAVDSLFDNGRRGRPVTGPGNRPLKSLSDMLKGKQGRFRQNLLGKRVDYSGRSVIVVGPQLKLHQAGLPKQMALELFKPFVMKRLVELNYAQNIKSAKRMVERYRPQVWDVLEDIITDHPVLLNRAPTLHRLGIQAFEPQLVEGKAIQLHPLVCAAFNADFDGDQMAVHLPLSPEAQAEARLLMLSSNNILKPSDGRPVALPSQDMIVGLYHLTTKKDGGTGEGRVFSSPSEAIMALDIGQLDLNAKVKIRLENFVPGARTPAPEGWNEGEPALVETTLGQVIFNDLLPEDYPWVDADASKGALSEIVNDLSDKYPKATVAATLDNMKDAGFYWAARSGVTVAISDVALPKGKARLLEDYEGKAAKIQSQYDNGLISNDERRTELIDIWNQATEEIAENMRNEMPEDNTINRMVTSGARGNWMQVRQIAGIRGLVANPQGEIIPRPIKSSYREGLSVLEYFIATHGARKGLADTALRTANSGYLTRRLVDVSQDVIIREVDCGTTRGLTLPVSETDESGNRVIAEDAENSIYARNLAVDAKDADGNVIAPAGTDLGDATIDKLFNAGVDNVKVRSVITCESAEGTCAVCYGRSLAGPKTVDIGESVGIIAAQSIGEPGTQLTMRTFHTGGAVSVNRGEDITQGLPRIQELFEARTPKGVSPIAEATGTVKIEEGERQNRIIITPDHDDKDLVYPVLRRSRLLVEDGDHVKVGDQLIAGVVDPKEVLRIMGPRAAQRYLVNQVQDVYRSQGVAIHDKHVEVIVRQMLRRGTVIESGSTSLLPGELVDQAVFEAANKNALANGGAPAHGRPEVMGITKASLATDSWLSAASFQETTRVLTQAAMEGKQDPLVGLKENVIIGKLIPAGTGLPRYDGVVVEPSEEALALMSSDGAPRVEGYDYGNAGSVEFNGEFSPSIVDDYDFGANFS